MAFVDLLGLDPPSEKRPSTPPPVVAPAQEIQQPVKVEAAAIRSSTPPPALVPVPAPASGKIGTWGGGSDPSGRSFLVRCKDRWRVRAEPALSAKVVGTISNGTIVVAAAEDDTLTVVSQPPNPLWVRCVHFEAADPQGVSEMQRDASSGSQMWCLRRNALGFGLYELGVEDNQELQALSDELSEALRATTIAGISESTEEVSTTWKLLSAADTVSSFVSSWTPSFSSKADEVHIEQLKPSRDQADAIFERRQREQLISTARLLRQTVARLVEVKAEASKELPMDLQRRLERLCELLPQGEHAKPSSPESLLTQTTEFCSRVEKSGVVAAQNRLEFIASCQRCSTDLEDYIRTLKLNRGSGDVNLLDARSGGYSERSSSRSTGVPLLAPPPKPKTKVSCLNGLPRNDDSLLEAIH